MNKDRTATWDQITWGRIKSTLSAHWGKLTVEDLCLLQCRSEARTPMPPTHSQAGALTPDGLALARHGS